MEKCSNRQSLEILKRVHLGHGEKALMWSVAVGFGRKLPREILTYGSLEVAENASRTIKLITQISNIKAITSLYKSPP